MYLETVIGTLKLADQFIVNTEEVFTKKINIIKQKDSKKYDKIFKELEKENFVILESTTKKKLLDLLDYLENHLKESNKPKGKLTGKQRDYFKRNLQKKQKQFLNNLLLIADNKKIVSVPEMKPLPYLSLLTGIPEHPFNDLFLIPAQYFIDLYSKSKRNIFVDYFLKEFYFPKNVLPPKSAETIKMFAESFKQLSQDNFIPEKILDMGCGSGVITILLKEVFPESEIFFSDILPEAVGSTYTNLERTYSKEEINLTGLPPGDLFLNISANKYKFDLINFNLPWINAPARNRQELALNDQNQRLAKLFFNQVTEYLAENGIITIGYSNNSGEKFVENLKEIISVNGLIIKNIVEKRIHSYQSGRKWMKIFSWTLKKQQKDKL